MRTKMTSSHGRSTVYTVYSSTLQSERMAQVRGYNTDSKTHSQTPARLSSNKLLANAETGLNQFNK